MEDVEKRVILFVTLWRPGSVVDRYYFQDDIAFVVAAVPIGLLDIEVVVLSKDTAVVVVVVAAVELGLLVGDKSAQEINSVIK